MVEEGTSPQPDMDEVERLRQRLGSLNPRQVAIWRRLSPARRVELACQMYQFTLEVVRTTERQGHPGLTSEALNWRVIRRMHGDFSLGRVHEADAYG